MRREEVLYKILHLKSNDEIATFALHGKDEGEKDWLPQRE